MKWYMWLAMGLLLLLGWFFFSNTNENANKMKAVRAAKARKAKERKNEKLDSKNSDQRSS